MFKGFSVIVTETLKTIKYHIFFGKTLLLSVILDRRGSNDENIFKKELSIKILKIVG